MAELTWTRKIEIDGGVIDSDHKKLILIFNLFFSTKGDVPNDVFCIIIDDLTAYTKSHFFREEQLQETARFNDIVGHKNQHNEIIMKLEFISNLLKNDAERTTLNIRSDLLLLIRSWLFDHILVSDTKMRPYKDKIIKASLGMNPISKYQISL